MIYVMLKGYPYDSIDCTKPAIAMKPEKAYRKDNYKTEILEVSKILLMVYVVLKKYLYNPIDCVKLTVAIKLKKVYEKDNYKTEILTFVFWWSLRFFR